MLLPSAPDAGAASGFTRCFLGGEGRVGSITDAARGGTADRSCRPLVLVGRATEGGSRAVSGCVVASGAASASSTAAVIPKWPGALTLWCGSCAGTWLFLPALRCDTPRPRPRPRLAGRDSGWDAGSDSDRDSGRGTGRDTGSASAGSSAAGSASSPWGPAIASAGATVAAAAAAAAACPRVRRTSPAGRGA